MKNLQYALPMLSLVAILLTTSCKKNWVCECKTENKVIPVEIVNANKEIANKTCENYNYTIYSKTGGCKLK